jgi:hypothetical protein
MPLALTVFRVRAPFARRSSGDAMNQSAARSAMPTTVALAFTLTMSGMTEASATLNSSP